MAACSGKCSGYSAVIVISACGTSVLTHGFISAAGVYHDTFLWVLYYNDASQVAVAIALVTSIFLASGPLAGFLVNLYGCRAVGILGGGFAGVGMAISTLSCDVNYTCLMYGAVCGVGLGFSNMSAMTEVATRFRKYRPLLLAVTSSAVGVGAFLFPVLIVYLSDQYSWRGSLLIIGGIMFHLIPCAAVFWKAQTDTNSPTAPVTETPRSKPTLLEALNLHIFLNRDYVLLCMSNVLVRAGTSVVYVHLGSFAISVGKSKDQAAILYSTMGAVSTLGKIIFGGMLQVPKCTAIHTFILGFVCIGAATTLLPVFSGDVGLHVLAAGFGFGMGCHTVSIMEMSILFLESKHTSNGYGNVLLFCAVGHMIGGPVASLLYEVTGSYAVPFYWGGAVTFLGCVLMIVPLISRSCIQKNSEDSPSFEGQEEEFSV